ncbi:hypothetical protein ASD04_14880 [Devosia sp. Root436]|uniref:hypothetical protein n=1 Tax=Devosia sp. Root436 TaxID=1736537 RepID=UPI0006FD1483|nr:hypothetical protein [Devosia sp. Root436]KQX35323.1 hypothetical protein ASD04_14880 [Devosia sp. Root436]
MTCIVGVVEKGKVWIGGDSAGVAGYDLMVRSDPKVFRNGDFVMGYTSSFRMGQLLAHRFQPPKRHADQDVYVYMVTSFVDALRQCFKDGGYASKENEREQGGQFLVGYEGRLFEIGGDYQVGENLDGYAACGCGGSIALGALHATSSECPTDRIRSALSASERHNAGVRGPFVVIGPEDKAKALA